MAYTVNVPLVGGGTRKRVIVDDNNNVDVDEVRVETINVVSKFQGDTAGFVTAYNYYSTPSPSLYEKQIEKFPFANETISTDIGDFHTASDFVAGNSSNTHGYMSGGRSPANASINNIQKFSMSSTGNATDVGDLTQARQATGISNVGAAGYNAGGFQNPPPAYVNTIDKFPFSSDANATDVGNLTETKDGEATTGISSPDHGYMAGGYGVPNPAPPPSYVATNVIEKFPFSTDEDASDVGDLTGAIYNSHQLSSLTNGYVIGGQFIPASTPPFNPVSRNIEKFPFATDENSQSVQDLAPTLHVKGGASVSSFEGGYAIDNNQNYKFLFASEATLSIVATFEDENAYAKVGESGLTGHQV